MRTLSGYLISLSDKSTIDRIAKYNAEIYLTGIFHDKEMKNPIEISPEIFIGNGSMNTPIYEAFIEKLSVQKVRQMSLSQFREIVQSDLIDLLHSTPTDAELEKFKTALTVSEKCKVRNLPYRLARLSEELHFPPDKEVLITCTAFGAASMLNIFPPVIRQATQEMAGFIHNIMDSYFNNWKNRSYQGDLFPNTLAICETPATSAAAVTAAEIREPNDSSSLARLLGSQRFSFFAANEDESQTADAASAGPAPR